MKGFHETAAKEIEKKRAFSELFTKRKKKEGDETKSFEHFVFMGVPPDSSKPKLRVLALYPYYPLRINASEFESIICHSFPLGLSTVIPSNGREYVVLDEFTFTFTREAGTLYGCCVKFRVTESTNTFFVSEKNRNYPFCVCVLTKETFIAAHFRFLTHLVKYFVGWSTIKEQEWDVQAIKLPKGVTPVMLKHMNPIGRFARWKNLNLTKDFIMFVRQYGRLKRGSSDPELDRLGIKLPKSRCSLQRSLGYPAIDCLFSVFTVDNILKMMAAVLLEHQVVVLSSKAYYCSSVIIALRSLIYPFKFIYGFTPILPNKSEYHAILSSPFPIIVGMLKTPEVDLTPISEPFCIVDTDNGTVKDRYLADPIFNEKLLKQNLESYLRQRKASIRPPSKKIIVNGNVLVNPKWTDFYSKLSHTSMPGHFLSTIKPKFVFSMRDVDQVIDIFNTFFGKPVCDLINGSIVTDSSDIGNPVCIFNRVLFEAINEKEKFLLKLTDSSKFTVLVEKQVDKLTLRASINSSEKNIVIKDQSSVDMI
jgi:hypothetical protein